MGCDLHCAQKWLEIPSNRIVEVFPFNFFLPSLSAPGSRLTQGKIGEIDLGVKG
jgi:hypothetical protein